MNTFSEQLRATGAGIWEQIHAHPFVVGMGDGTLESERFAYYMVQDYLYLIEFSRLFALAASKSEDLQTMGKFAELLHATLHVEMDLHRQYAAKFGLTPRDLETARIAPTTHAYSRHLLHTVQTGTIAEMVTAILPCQWGYHEIAVRLKEQGGLESGSLYTEWIAMYASDEFKSLSDWLRGWLDDIAVDFSDAERRRLTELYLTGSRYEWMFWEMAYRMEEWPV
ncbi:thiaminase /4-amino-5-aminomethyl-2-methylpyrimidine deaminase [Tumebacillus sp. BK434]|uniref:thiaminase II n=1 Tax=Tumebacillus sp. BK434 TaxID=2512169 RepID=UPI0010508660|nr:thiaminase II [Tumebacillus sp. BK434]TCP55565.1 thiaminase /4-amino-5-aminomethyl-2-methylpyrimidine deaminase [Tumebacillus sp. BK434]